jgi:hypothetical protein
MHESDVWWTVLQLSYISAGWWNDAPQLLTAWARSFLIRRQPVLFFLIRGIPSFHSNIAHPLLFSSLQHANFLHANTAHPSLSLLYTIHARREIHRSHGQRASGSMLSSTSSPPVRTDSSTAGSAVAKRYLWEEAWDTLSVEDRKLCVENQEVHDEPVSDMLCILKNVSEGLMVLKQRREICNFNSCLYMSIHNIFFLLIMIFHTLASRHPEFILYDKRSEVSCIEIFS